MQVTAVIGAGWGDEGKGLMTDFITNQYEQHLTGKRAIVCRFNGGAQAGHTVVVGDNRHVFSHFGSGTLRGAITYLTKDFIVNPVLALKEYEILQKITRSAALHINPQAVVTTPFDVILNHILEESRGQFRHGSCGSGIFETTLRSRFPEFTIRFNDLHAAVWERSGPGGLTKQLEQIQALYVPMRLTQMGLSLSNKWKKVLANTKLIEDFVKQCCKFTKLASRTNLESLFLQSPNSLMKSYNLVFEGAQGLMLDQNNKDYFPHLTPSNTGIMNVLGFLDSADLIDKVDFNVIYCTRAYATRHGAGGFPRHEATLKYEDQTNAPNAWQGSLRFGHLDLNILTDAINKDFANIETYRCAKKFGYVEKQLAMTCLDQVGPQVKFWVDDTLCEMDTAFLPEITADRLGVMNRYESYGPSAESVRSI